MYVAPSTGEIISTNGGTLQGVLVGVLVEVGVLVIEGVDVGVSVSGGAVGKEPYPT
jgi:hypothetical protein